MVYIKARLSGRMRTRLKAYCSGMIPVSEKRIQSEKALVANSKKVSKSRNKIIFGIFFPRKFFAFFTFFAPKMKPTQLFLFAILTYLVENVKC